MVINIVGAGGISNTIRTKIVEVIVKDNYGEESILECIVLNKACGKIIPVDMNKFDDHDKRLLRESLVYTQGGDRCTYRNVAARTS